MTKKILFWCYFLIISSLLTNQINAQVYCRNETDKPVWLALAYNFVPNDIVMVSTGDIWISEGWFYIPPQGIVQLTTHIGYSREYGTKTNFFYYAEQVNGRDWYGARSYLVDYKAERSTTQLAFKIEKAQNSFTYKDVPQLRMMPFKGATNTREAQYTIVLRPDDPNEGFIKHDESWNEAFDKGQIPVIEFSEPEPYTPR